MYRVDQRVDGLYDENSDDMWYPGRIQCVHGDDTKTAVTFEVLYDDGEVETNVRLEFLRLHVPGTICVGSRVLCRYDGGEEFYPGQISDVHENGRYTIAYEDGEVEEDVPVDYIMEPQEEQAEAEDPADDPSENMDNIPRNEPQQEEEGDLSIQDSRNPIEDEDNKEHVNNEPIENAQPPRNDPSSYEIPLPYHQHEDLPSAMVPEMSAERRYITESLQLLEKRLSDAASTKSVLSTLVKQMRAYPQVTADLVHEHGGERLIIDALKFHQSHAVIQCYGCVLLRRLCFLCVKSSNCLLRNGIVELIIQAMNVFTEDAILQASGCGALAVFTRDHAGLNILIEFQVAQLVLSTLIYHKTYSVHTRQVHYYACEVLLELCELDDLQTLNLLCGEQEEAFMGEMSPISLLLFLLRQGLSLDDKKACCAVGSLLMCLAASGRRAAALILGLNGLAELSTVMARYPTEPSIQKYSSAASKQIAQCSVRQSPTKKIKDTATVILREAESMEHTPTAKSLIKKGAPRRSMGTGKRKSNPSTGYGASANSRGAAYSPSSPYRNAPAFSKSLYAHDAGFGSDMDSFGYPVTAPQHPSSLVILDGNLGADSGFRSTNKCRPLSKEHRQSELFDAYGIQEFPNSTNGRSYGTKRAQLESHLASAELKWATSQHIPPSTNPYSRQSVYFDPGSAAYSHRGLVRHRQNRWSDDPHNPIYDPEVRQLPGAKRNKRNTGVRSAFQVRVENQNQLRVSRETQLPYPSPQRLGAATKRAAKARQKRISSGGQSSLTGRLNDASSESLNDYATQLFQDNTSRAGSGIPTSSRLTPREKEEIRERERLSFAEKLHKMIDKAKSTLANGSMTFVPAMDTVPRSTKTGRRTKTPRKARELSSTPPEENRSQPKKTRTAIGSTPPDPTETRPAKPTSTRTKRDALIAAPRAKPTFTRDVVAPRATANQKPRATVKPSSGKVAAVKPVTKHQAEHDKKPSVDIAPVCSASEGDVPGQGEPDAITVHPNQEIEVPVESKRVEQVEPTVLRSLDVAKVERPSDEAIESQSEVDPTPDDDGNTGDIPGAGVAATPVGPQLGAHAPVDVPLLSEEDRSPESAREQSEPSVNVQQEPTGSVAPDHTEDQPSATVDAMYGDTYGEFDDNGGDDEDMTSEVEADPDDAHAPVTETSAPPAAIPLQESKRGEALYDDGYDEFDEDDEVPNDEETKIETENAPATEPVDNQDEKSLDNIASQPPDIEVEFSVNLLCMKGEQFAGEETPPAAVEEVVSAPTELGGEGDGNLLNDNDVGDTVGDLKSIDAAEDSVHADQVDAILDENADIGRLLDGEEQRTTDGGDIEGDEPDANASASILAIESTEPEDVVGSADPSIEPAALKYEADNLGDLPVSNDFASEEAPAISAPTDDKPSEEAETCADPNESSTANDPGTKKLSVDNSIDNIQSVRYDEESFDNEEKQQETELIKAGEISPIAVAIEEAQYDEGDNIGEDPVKSEIPTGMVCSPDREEEESKPLATGSSELSVQFNAYEEKGFDGGVQEDAYPDQSEDKAPDEEPNGNYAVEHGESSGPIAPVDDTQRQPESNNANKSKGSTVGNGAVVDAPDIYGDEDFDSTAQDDLPKEQTAQLSVPKSKDKHSEPQELETIDSVCTPKSEVIAENEAPGMIIQDEAEYVQEPQANDPDVYNDDTQDDTVSDNHVSAGDPDTEDNAESSTHRPVAVENININQADEIGKPENGAPEITAPTDTEVTQELALENTTASSQFATYDDDEFDNGAEEKKVTPSAAVEDSTKTKLEADPAKYPNDEVGDSAVATTDNIDDHVVVKATVPEPHQLGRLDGRSSEDAPDSITMLDKAVSTVVSRPETAPVTLAENIGEQRVDNETNISDVVDSPISGMAPPRPELLAALLDKDPRQQKSATPEDRPDVSFEPENAGDTVLAEAQSEKPVKPDGAGVDEPVEKAATVEATDEAPGYAQGDDAFDKDAPESTAIADEIPPDTSADVTRDEEDQYGDTEFDEAETTPVNDASTTDPPPDNISPAEKDEAAMYDHDEVPKNDVMNEVAGQPGKLDEAEPDNGETVTNVNGDAAAAEIVGGNSAGVDQDTSAFTTRTDTETPAINSNMNATYSPDKNVDDLTELAVNDEGYDDGFDDDRSPDKGIDDSVQCVDEVPDSTLKDDGYDDGFDDDNTPSIKADDSSKVIERSQFRGESAAQDGIDTKAAENDVVNIGGVVPIVKVEPVESHPDNEKSVSDNLETANPASNKPEAVPVETVQPEPVVSDVDPEASQVEVAEPDLQGVNPENGEADTEKVGDVEPNSIKSQTANPATDEPAIVEQKAAESDAADTEVVEESPPERSIDGTTPEKSAAPEVCEKQALTGPLEVSSMHDAVTSDNASAPVAEVPVEAPVQTPTETNDQNVADHGTNVSEAQEMDPAAEITATKESVNDQPPNEKPVEEVEAEHPVDATARKPRELVQSEKVQMDLPVPSSKKIGKSPDSTNNDLVAIDGRDKLQSTDEVIKENTVKVGAEPVKPSATAPAPAEAQTIVEDASAELDYAEDDALAYESPIFAEVATPEKPMTGENAEVLEASEEYEEESEAVEALVIDVKPRPSEVAVEPANATPPVSEGSKNEDQYDDDEDYNEFEEHDNESTTPASAPNFEVPQIVARGTEAATEEEYEDDYGEEETAASVAVTSSKPSEPPASAHEGEIEEVADGPEAEEEAYADDQDEYNHEYDEDAAPAPTPTPKSSVPNVTAAEASDDYEDDNEEDYAEDEVEDSPPKPTSVAAATPKSDDEMEEEVGYDSEEYADSDS